VIAIVDDDREMREALCDLLLVEGLACHAFESAEAFFAAYAPGAFASVVTDVRMPGVTGLELLARIKRSEPALPVIVVTSSGDLQTRQEALEGGARALLVKPIHNAELLSHLAAILD
jgi:FixJ family two-component response regulator